MGGRTEGAGVFGAVHFVLRGVFVPGAVGWNEMIGKTGVKLRLVTAVAVSFWVTGGLAWAESDGRSFAVAPGDSVVVDTNWGDVEVRVAREAALVEVVVERAERTELEYHQRDGKVVVVGRKKARRFGWWFFGRSGGGPRFRITVPWHHNVEVTTTGGDIVIDDLQGNVVTRASGGDVRIGRILGRVDVWASGGDIHVRGGQGVVAEASGGDIRVSGVHGFVDARTSGGDVGAEIVGGLEVPSRLRTTGGDVEVVLADGIGVTLEAQTSGGSVTAAIPVFADAVGGGSRLSGHIGGGGALLTVRASGGDIRLLGLSTGPRRR